MVKFVKEIVIIIFVCMTKEDLTKLFKDKAFRN